MIHGVTGPNEYENNINNNWYTNTIACWVLRYTRENYLKFKEESTAKISDDELAHWQEIAENMYFPVDEELGIFVQHDTFLDKDLKPVADIPASDLPVESALVMGQYPLFFASLNRQTFYKVSTSSMIHLQKKKNNATLIFTSQ